MTDLSDPPAALVQRSQPDSTSSGGGSSLLDWPAPPLSGFPETVALESGEGCELVGAAGGTTRVLLLNFDPEHGMATLQAPQARRPLDVRFDQIQRLTLLNVVKPKPARAGEPAAKFRPEIYRATLASGKVIEGLTLGHVDHAAGLFLYEPVDEDAAVKRIFIPRQALARIEFGIEAEADSDQSTAVDDLPPLEVSSADTAAAVTAPAAPSPSAPAPASTPKDAPRAEQVAEILSDRQAATAAELEDGIARQARMPMMRLGEALVGLGFITEKQLQEAIALQRSNRGVPIGELLVRKGIVSRNDLQTALSRKMGYPMVDLGRFVPENEALSLISRAMCLRLAALPLIVRQGRLVVAVEDPSRAKALDEIEFAAGTKVTPVLAPAAGLPEAIDRAYKKLGADRLEARMGGAGSASTELLQGEQAGAMDLLASMEEDSDDDDVKEIEQSDNSLVRLINSMILEAQSQGVSDIHIESQPGRQKLRIRFRRDGVLKPYLELSPAYRSAMISRIKVMCDLDISERRKPQDGKINFGRFVAGSKLELRVATIPTFNGLEDAVLRLLSSAKLMSLDEIGLTSSNLDRVKEIVQRPYGMFLCVGPTGSGKTTTLHSALGFINGPNRKIWTAEDPIEITQAGLRQVQVNAKIDWTFAKALRSFLRADPDVIMVGEIRDKETAQVAIESSLTGHLVMSTLHTNSAPETVSRLLDMGMDPFNFGDSLLGVLSQRLLRTMCPHCRSHRLATSAELSDLTDDYLNSFGSAQRPSESDLLDSWKKRFGRDADDLDRRDPSGRGVLLHYSSPGCEKCGGTGYRGRSAVHELLTVNRALRLLIQTGARIDELQKAALDGGMRTLRQDGIEKVLTGVTTIEEVRGTTNA